MKKIKVMLTATIWLGAILTTFACSHPERNVIMTTYFKKGQFQWNALEKVINNFNKVNADNSEFDHRKIILKFVQNNGVEKEVNAGYYGVRKLPNLFTSYADEVVKYSKTLQEQLVDVEIPDLSPCIDKPSIIDSYWQETMYKGKQYTVPIGKSLDLMFINKKLLLEVFAKIEGLTPQANLLLPLGDNLSNYQGMNGQWKVNKSIDWSKFRDQLNVLKEWNSLEAMKAGIITWSSYLSLVQVTSHLLKNLANLSNLNEVYAVAMDDLPNGLYVQYANNEALNSETKSNEFLYRENSSGEFVLNLKGKSFEILQKRLSGLQKLKDLANRTSNDIKRNTGLHVKVPTATSPQGTFASTLFNQSKALVGIGSTSGVQFLLQEERLKPEDIWALPLPFSTGGKYAIQQGPGIAMFKMNDPIKDKISEAFIKYVTSQEANEVYAFDSGYLPINKVSYESGSSYGQKLHDAPSESYLQVIAQVWELMNAKKITTASPPLTQWGAIFRQTVLKSLNIFYQDLLNASYPERPLTEKEFLNILKTQTKDDGINEFIIEQ